MALSSLYITAVDLESWFVDKDTGLPLAGGQIQFWVDGARTTPKLVYELTGDPTNSQGGGYSYAPLPNPVTLSDVGTIQDASGNNIPIYYYPYDSNGQLQLYYIVVVNALGVVQFTREAWPNVTLDQVAGASESISTNQLSNSQFSLTNFGTGQNGQVIGFAGNVTNLYQIAPGWTLSVTHTDAGNITVTRTSLAGSNNYPTNPPYWLTITPGANITALTLYQRIKDPGIWSETSNGGDGWVSGAIVLGAGSGLEMRYTPSTGTFTSILNASNLTLLPATFSNTVQLPPSNNTSTADSGYIDVMLVLPTGALTTFSSVQLVSTNVNLGNVPYVQDSPERQQSYLWNAYLPGTLAKATKSFLIGWDFPLNPAQFGGPSGTLGVNNASKYIWDQTIAYSGVNNGVTYSRASTGALRLTGTVTGTAAIIQYVTQAQAREILNQPFSVKVSAVTSNTTAISSSVSVFWTAGTTLPTLSTGLSVVGSLDANGSVATVNNAGGSPWFRVSPADGLGTQFSLTSSATSNFNQYDFTEWTLGAGAGATTATFLAIVVGFSSLPVGQTIDINSVSLVPGVQATIPAPQSLTEVLNECRHYYWKTYERATTPGTATPTGAISFPAQQTATSTATWSFYPTSFYVDFPQQMRIAPGMIFFSLAGTLNFISFVTGTNNSTPDQITNASIDIPPSSTSQTFTSTWKPVFPVATGTSTATRDGVLYVLSTSIAVQNVTVTPGGMAEAFYAYHCVADARLGIL